MQVSGHKGRVSIPLQELTTVIASLAGASPEVVKQLGFEVISEQFVNEYNSTAILYRHKKTGAEIMSVSNSDENKVFGIVFRTPP